MSYMNSIWGTITMENDIATTAVIFAGGVGTRMHSKDLPKQFLCIHGKPILIWTISVFESCPEIDSIVVVCADAWLGYCKNLLKEFNLDKVKAVVAGGETGQLSIRSGLLAASHLSNPKNTVVLIHDGVRPLIDMNTIQQNIESVEKYGSSVTCVPAKETILVQENNQVEIIPRERVLLARAPQSFWLSDILDAHNHAYEAGKTDYIDSATLMKTYGHKLHLVVGPYENIKITTQDDYYSMRAILDSRENNQLYCDGEDK